MDETYIKVKGEWMYLYRAVDREGKTIDFLFTKRRNKYVAHKFLIKAINNNGSPKVINIDHSGANKEAIRTYNKRSFKRIKIRQCKYLNNRVEADHRFIKWRTQNMLGFKSFESASRTLTGIEIVRMIKKGQISFPWQIIGTDVSKPALDHAIKTSEAHLKTANNVKGYKQWLKWALGFGSKEDLWVVMEHTGYYSYQFELVLQEQQILYSKVSALEIKRSVGLGRGNNLRIQLLLPIYTNYFSISIKKHLVES